MEKIQAARRAGVAPCPLGNHGFADDLQGLGLGDSRIGHHGFQFGHFG